MSAPAGWYPDETGTLRWWDGQRWVDAAAPATPSPVLMPPGVTPGSANTLWIWLIVLMPVVTIATSMLFVSQMLPGLIHLGLTMPTNGSPPDARRMLVQEQALLFTPWYVLTVLVAGAAYGLGVWFAYLDVRELEHRGFVNPFHWAWMFLSAWVYLIGRTVVVGRRGGRGAAPLVVFITIQVVGFLVITVWLTVFMTQFLQIMIANIPASP